MGYLIPSLPPLKVNVDYNLIISIFLLVLAVAGNFISESISCKMRKSLTRNIYTRNLILLLIIYFSLMLNSDKNVIPTSQIKTTIGIWVMFMLFNKMSVHFTIIILILLFLALVCKNWIDYYNAVDKEKYKKEIDNFDNNYKYLLLAASILIVIGFLIYFKKQYSEHNKDFNYTTFIFGPAQCE